jgi:hypothetical protein
MSDTEKRNRLAITALPIAGMVCTVAGVAILFIGSDGNRLAGVTGLALAAIGILVSWLAPGARRYRMLHATATTVTLIAGMLWLSGDIERGYQSSSDVVRGVVIRVENSPIPVGWHDGLVCLYTVRGQQFAIRVAASEARAGDTVQVRYATHDPFHAELVR